MPRASRVRRQIKYFGQLFFAVHLSDHERAVMIHPTAMMRNTHPWRYHVQHVHPGLHFSRAREGRGGEGPSERTAWHFRMSTTLSKWDEEVKCLMWILNSAGIGSEVPLKSRLVGSRSHDDRAGHQLPGAPGNNHFEGGKKRDYFLTVGDFRGETVSYLGAEIWADTC